MEASFLSLDERRRDPASASAGLAAVVCPSHAKIIAPPNSEVETNAKRDENRGDIGISFELNGSKRASPNRIFGASWNTLGF
jgi:hypothetical protein